MDPPTTIIDGWLRDFPKVELHVHLDGSFQEAFLWDLACKDADVLPEEGKSLLTGETMHIRRDVKACTCQADFSKLISCKGKRSLLAMLDCFSVFLPLVQGRMREIEELAYRFCLRQAEQNVVYTEVRYSPHLLVETAGAAGNAMEAYEAVTRGLRRGCAEQGITINQILCCIDFRPDWSAETIDLVVKHNKDYPCAAVGLDVAAGEDWLEKPSGPHQAALKKANELGIHVTIHCGETGGPAHVRTAIRELGATRIGHGYAVIEDKELLDEIVEKKIHFEACPTSSVETGSVPRGAPPMEESQAPPWSQHPIKAFIEAGASLSLSSDDPSVFATSLTADMDLCLSKIGLAKDHIVKCTLSAVEACFAADEEKIRLRKMIEKYVGVGDADSDANGKPKKPKL
jgi:adenosine deaminase